MRHYSYLDASAIVKLAVREIHTDAMESHAVSREALFSSRLSETEVLRGVRRAMGTDALEAAYDALGAVFLRDIDPNIVRRAGLLGPRELRSGDAIHLATALSLEEPNLLFITYDSRLADAATAAGLRVVQPGVDERAAILPATR